jgi:hypothetical protein
VVAFQKNAQLQVRLQDVLALVVGYGMAALFFRAFWPSSRPSAALGVPLAGLYVWLGLAMSGPIILLPRWPRDPAWPGRPTIAGGSRSWAELAWLLIGMYWIVLGVFAIPARLHGFKLGDSLLFGLVPLLVALALRLFGPKRSVGPDAMSAWTHTAAIALLATWPIAWICLIVLGTTLR